MVHSRDLLLEKTEQLDSAVVGLYDNLTQAKGKKGDDYQKKKKEGLELLKEAEKCYQLMHMLHEKADSQRKKIYQSAADSDIYHSTSKLVSETVNKELKNLSSQYYGLIEKSLPELVQCDVIKTNIQQYCGSHCQVTENSVYSALSKTFQHELSMIIGKCMLQAETRITTLVVESMVSRLNDLTKHVDDLNSQKAQTEPAKQDVEHDEELDENIKQRRFTYTEKRKDIVKNDPVRSASISSIGRVKPDIPTKPKPKSTESPGAGDRVALVSPSPDLQSSEDVQSSCISNEKEEPEVIPEEKPTDDLSDAKPVSKEKPVPKEKPLITAKPKSRDVTPEPTPEHTEPTSEPTPEPTSESTPEPTPEPTLKHTKEENPEERPEEEEIEKPEDAEEERSEEQKEEEEVGAEVAEIEVEVEPAVEEPVEKEDEPVVEPEAEEAEVEAEEISRDLVEEETDGLTNGISATPSSMDFNVIEETAALSSITKSRVRGPKKKTRPTKTCAITTLDPFEVAKGSDRSDSNGAPDPPEPEIKPKPKPKKFGGAMMGMGMPGMGAMNSELSRKLGRKKQESEGDSSSKSPEAPEEQIPKKSPYRPPGAKAMPGMGFGMGGAMGNELAGKLKSRNKEEGSSETTPSKPKGDGSKFPKPDNRPRSPGSLGSNLKHPPKPEKSESRTKSMGSSKKS